MTTLLYITTFLAVIIYIINRVKSEGFLTLHSAVLGSISIFYLLAPSLTFIFGKSAPKSTYFASYIYNSTEIERLIIYFIILITILLIVFSKKVRFVLHHNHGMRNTAISEDLKNNADSNRMVIEIICKRWFVLLFIIGLLGYAVVVYEIGFSNLIFLSASSRGESATIGRSGSILAYAQILAKFLIASLAPGIMWYESKKNKLLLILLIIIFGLSFMLEIFIAGKSNFILFLIPFVVYFFTKRGKLKTKYVILVGILAIVLVVLLENWFYILEYGVSVSRYRTDWSIETYIMRYVSEFTYPYSNLLFSNDMNQIYGYRFFVDYLAVIINLIPAVLLGGFQISPLYLQTTEFYQGMYSYMVDGVPNDYIFFCLRQLGIIGLVIITICWGQVINYIDKRVHNLRKKLTALNINSAHLLTCCVVFGIVITMIEPYSAITTQPILICSILICIQLDKKVK